MAKKKIRLLKDVHFDFEGAHVALTSKGAASMVDEPFLLKSLEVEASTESESLLTQASDTSAGADPSVSKSQTNENDEDTMSEEVIKSLKEELNALKAEREAERLALAVEKATLTFGKYEMDAEVVKELSEKFHGEEMALVVKALDAMVVIKEEAITKAKETVEAESTDVAKALEQEAGHDQEQAAPAAEGLLARVQKAKQKLAK